MQKEYEWDLEQNNAGLSHFFLPYNIMIVEREYTPNKGSDRYQG